MSLALHNKQVVITGGIGGLGEAVVRAFVQAGAQVHIPNFFDSAPNSFAFANDERVSITHSVDLTSEAAVSSFYASVGELWASVNLAGGFAMAPLVDTSLADFMKMFDRNAVTCFLSCREAVRGMLAHGGGGRIVNVAARPAVSPVGGMVAYATAKAAVAAITTALAEEHKHDDILVNAILPSIIDTADNRKAMPGAAHETWPKPAQLATSILFLASPDNQVTSGSLVSVYGRA